MRNQTNEQRALNCEALHNKLLAAIWKHSKKCDGVSDSEIVAVLASLIGDFVSMRDQEMHSEIRKFIDGCITNKIAFNLEQKTEQPHTLHS